MDCNPKILGIAGGSGTGKTTVAIGLYRKYPDKIAVLHLDDYYKDPADAPRIEGGAYNWDHPDSLRFADLARDLAQWKRGEPITVMTKSELYNPAYDPALRNKIPQRIEPKAILILEGYLAFYDKRVRDLMTRKVYLDMPIEESLKRRMKPANSIWYLEHVVVPVHKEFVETTKAYADVMLDISEKSPAEVGKEIEALIAPWLAEPC